MNAGVRYAVSGTSVTTALYGGPQGHCELAAGEYPTSLAAATAPKPGNFAWPLNTAWTGVGFQRSAIGSGAVKDGTTHTYLIGEKYVNLRHYDDGVDPGDNDTLYSGFGNDNYRSTEVTPLNDQRDQYGNCRFGGPHTGVIQFAFCDGSVHAISVGIDQVTHRHLGERNDGAVIDDSVLQ
jgi:prepilin-type processing-associated H-X9-DG protein